MRATIAIAIVIFACSVAGGGQTEIEVEPIKELKPTGSLGTCGYAPTSQ